MSKKLYALLALVMVFSLVLVGCQTDEPTEAPVEDPVDEPEVVEPEVEVPADDTVLICQVTDVGGIDDKSFNATAWKGVEDAMADFPNVEGKYLESQQQTDYEVNINAFVEEGCDLIIGVGFLMADAVAAAAGTYADQLFATIDVDYLDFPNLRGSGFAINQATFLNGYLAAGMTETGAVGTYVGIAFPATTVFMDGYALGVEHYNAVHGTDVQVLGWDYVAQEGLATGDFENTDNGRAMGENLMDEGADIIMPVAGPVGLGTLAVMEERGTGLLVGVDNDWSLANPASADYVLASAMKNMDKFVYGTIAALAEGTFEAGNWIGTIENGGVGIAFGSAWIDLIPADLLDEVAALEAGIVDGSVATLPGAMPEPEMPTTAVGVDLAALDGIEIEFWHEKDGRAGDAVIAIIEEFNATNPYGITVVGYDQGNYGAIFDLMNAAINTGDLPDLVIGYTNQYLAWHAAADVIVDMNPYIADAAVGMTAEDIADFYPVFWDQDEIDGYRYGFPVQRSAQTMFYNESFAAELGFDAAPTTPAEFKEQACAAAAFNGDGTGGWFVNTGASAMAGWAFSFGADIETADGYDFTSAENQAAWEFVASLYAEGCAWTPENRYPNPEFAGRQGLFFTSSQAGIYYQASAFEESEMYSADEWVLIPFPGVDGPVPNIYGPSFAVVSSTPEEQLASWIFTKFFTTPDNQAAWVQASNYLPTRASVLPLLADFQVENARWASTLDYLTMNYKFEPRFESWSTVRSIVGEYAAQLIQDGFDLTTIPQLLADLQAEASEAHAETME